MKDITKPYWPGYSAWRDEGYSKEYAASRVKQIFKHMADASPLIKALEERYDESSYRQ